METWRDKTFGKYGQWVWITALTPFVLGGMFIWIASHPKHSSYISYLMIFGVLLLVPAIWACFYISQVRMALQEIVLDDGQLRGKLFYGKRVNLKAADIASIGNYPMTWRIRQINLYDRTRPGVEIRLKGGTIMRINAKTEGFDSLVSALVAFAKAMQIECSL